jgi:hypothetical protein
MHRALLIAPLALVALLAAACGDDAGDGEAVRPTDTQQATTPSGPQPSADDPVSMATSSLAASEGVDPADITLVTHEKLTWRDGSLGCPEPGKMYTQALVDGYRIVLRAGGEEYFYHGAANEPPFRCDDPDPRGAL